MLNRKNLPNCVASVSGKGQPNPRGCIGLPDANLLRNSLQMAARSRVIFQTVARYITYSRRHPMLKHGSPPRKVNVGSVVKPRHGPPVGARLDGNKTMRQPQLGLKPMGWALLQQQTGLCAVGLVICTITGVSAQ